MESTPEGNSQRLMEMEMGTLLQDGTEEKWEAISDLDAFFARVYDYFNERGLRCIITARIINLLTLLFTIMFTVFLLDVMNWQGLLYNCVSEETCASVTAASSEWRLPSVTAAPHRPARKIPCSPKTPPSHAGV